MGWLSLNPTSNECHYLLVKPAYNLNAKSLKDLYKERKGVRLTYLGDTKETKYTTQCSFDSHRDIGGFKGWIPDFTSYRKLMDTLKFMGYTPGLINPI